MNLVLNYLDKNILSNTVKINGIQSKMSLKLPIKVVAFFLGQPLYAYVFWILQKWKFLRD